MFKRMNLLAGVLASVSVAAQAAVTCGDILYASDRLTSDLHCTAGHTGVEIRGNDVVLDLDGHTLAGDIFQGIHIRGDRVTIRGPGRIKGFDLGLQAYDVSGLRVTGVTFSDMNGGISTVGLHGGLIEGNEFEFLPGEAVRIRGYSSGSTVLPSVDNHVTGNTFDRVGTGVAVCGYNASHQLIVDNTFKRITDFGVHLETGTNHNEIFDNLFHEGENVGIRISHSSMNHASGNYLKTGRIGMSIHDNSGHLNPTCAAPPMTGVVTGNVLEGNTVIDHHTAANLGLGTTASPVVTGNVVDNSKFYYNDIGVAFKRDAWNNRALRNAYTGTTTPIVDYGTGNRY